MSQGSSAKWQDHASSRRLQSRRLGRFGRTAIVLYTTIVLLIGWSYGAWRIHSDRTVTLDASHQQLATLSRGLASQIEAMVHDGVGAAQAGANVLRDSRRVRDPQQTLGEMLTGGSYVRSLFVVTGDQMVVANAPGENLTRSDATWFDELRSSQMQSWVGPVVTTAADGSLALPLAVRVAGDNGVKSWAGALIRISDLDQIYQGLKASRSTVAIVTLQGTALVQLPLIATNPMNMDVSKSEAYRRFLALPVQPITLVVGTHPVTGEPRQYAISRLNGLPLVATAGRSIEDALQEWRTRSAFSLGFLLFGTVIAYSLAIMLQQQLNRRFTALERSEARFQLAAAGANDGIFEWESDTGLVYCTPRVRELLKVPEAAGSIDLNAVRRLVHAEDLLPVTTAFRRHVEDREPMDVEARLLAGGEYRWFRLRGQTLWNERGEPIRLAGSIAEMHAAVLAQQAIAEARSAELHAKESLARELLLAQEQERKRLAGELHDGVGQNLSLLRNRAILLQRSGLPPAAAPHAQALLDLSTESIEDLRNVAQNLRPLHLEELGVTASLRSLLLKVEQSSDLAVQFRLEDVDDVIVGPAAAHVYRIAQEAINNVLKHAAAGRLYVDVIRDIDCVIIDIRDDGKGFRQQADATRSGLGLLSIRERCSILAAELKVESDGRSGTHLRVRIPVDLTIEHQVDALHGEEDV